LVYEDDEMTHITLWHRSLAADGIALNRSPSYLNIVASVSAEKHGDLQEDDQANIRGRGGGSGLVDCHLLAESVVDDLDFNKQTSQNRISRKVSG
jgi:hypothetical protein